MWFGSSGGGLCRYDGKKYSIYTTKDGLCSDDVNCIAEDNEGVIWIGTAAGISKFNERVFTNFPEEAVLCKSSVFSIAEDSEKNLWFGGSSGAYKYDTKNKSFRRYGKEDKLLDNFVTAILRDRKGQMWFGTGNGKIFIYQNNFFIEQERISNLSSNHIYFLKEDREENIWFGFSADGAWKYTLADARGNGEKLTQYTEKNGLAGSEVRSFCQDQDGNYWFGTLGSGLTRFDGKQFINFTVKNGLSSNLIWAIMQDREGNMWFGEYGTGASKLEVLPYGIYKKENGLLNNFIWAVKEDRCGNIWTGFYQPGISVIINPYDFKNHRILNYPTKASVFYFYLDEENNIWAATGDGIEILRYDSVKKIIRNIARLDTLNGLASNHFRYIYKDKKQNVWVGTSRGAAFLKKDVNGNYRAVRNYIYRDNSKMDDYLRTPENYDSAKAAQISNNYIYSIVEDDNSDLWFATSAGVSKLIDKKLFRNYNVGEGLANHDVRSVVKDGEGDLWFATGAGISRYEKKSDRFVSYTTKDGLSVDRLYFLEYDSTRNVLWIGSASGLDKFDITEYKLRGNKIFYHPASNHEFVEVETNTNAFCMDKKRNLWIGTIDGLINYYPDYKRPKNALEPLTHISSISIDRRDTLLKQNAVLPYELNNFTFYFTGISLSAPERVLYRYMIEGFDKNWSPAVHENTATYSNLPAGKYIFKVISCNNDGVWNKEPLKYSFTITPPWWQTSWFYLICILSTASCIWIFIKFREQSLEKEKEILEKKIKVRTKQLEEQKKIVEEKNKDITDSINYAKRIQQAKLPKKEEIYSALPNCFVLFKPKDIVSGDFYYFHKNNQTVFIASADCTGHGVPGALMSMIGSEKLDDAVSQSSSTSDVLKLLNKGIKTSLKQSDNNESTRDGMDIAICSIDTENRILKYAGANRPLWIIRKTPLTNGEGMGLEEIKATKKAIGGFTEVNQCFDTQEIELNQGDTFYIFTDGYADTFSGRDDKKLTTKKFKQILLEIQHKTMPEQEKHLENFIEDWKAGKEQVDDILVIGVRV